MNLNRTNLKIWGLKAKTWATMMILLEIMLGVMLVGWYAKTRIAIARAEAIASTLKVEKPVIENPTTEQQQIINYIKEVFGSHSTEALKIANCESHLNPKAFNDNTTWGGVGRDWGVFQINDTWQGVSNRAFLTDWKINVLMAKKIFDNRGWSAWTCKYVLKEAK